jgi:hypothetical protein
MLSPPNGIRCNESQNPTIAEFETLHKWYFFKAYFQNCFLETILLLPSQLFDWFTSLGSVSVQNSSQLVITHDHIAGVGCQSDQLVVERRLHFCE